MTSASRPAPACIEETRPPLFSQARTHLALGACACAAASAFVFAVDPSRYAVYPQCLLYNATGIYCAGCGATRAVYALLHGRVLDALHDNALFVAALPLLLYMAIPHLLTAWTRNAWPIVNVNASAALWRGGAIFLLLIAFMIARNLPGWPFDWLRPL